MGSILILRIQKGKSSYESNIKEIKNHINTLHDNGRTGIGAKRLWDGRGKCDSGRNYIISHELAVPVDVLVFLHRLSIYVTLVNNIIIQYSVYYTSFIIFSFCIP